MDMKLNNLSLFRWLLVVIVLGMSFETIAAGNIFVCYYVPSKRVPISTIPPDLCTHIIYAFADVTQSGIQPTSGSDVTKYTQLVNLKQSNPNLKILLSLQKGFPTMIDAGPTAMQNFTKNAITFLRKYGFDGIDFDWEFPSASEKNSYMKFLSIFRNGVNKESIHSTSSASTLLISMALTNNKYIASRAYDVTLLNKYIDFATVMTYDFHVYNAKYDNITGYNSPLVAARGESQYFSVKGMIGYYMGAGLSKSKILMGLPAYGRSWKLANASKTDVHSPASARGPGGPVINAPGVFIYMEICMALNSGATQVYDVDAGASYLYSGTTWVTYDDPNTYKKKCQWAMDTGLGGAGVWALALDDISGTCRGGPFPLLNTVKACLQ